MNLYKYASPTTFYPLAGKMIPWFAIPSAILFAIGLYVGFFVAPTDFQQGDVYRVAVDPVAGLVDEAGTASLREAAT